ncbi:methyltransferase domain protein [Aeromicrobium marinum DSM 15272]|uniref:Methyltransferase domain protein n=1 Tax=Aeromicrobium marinum DSM 15272 TaxID=585531 RepID=E2SFG1_9ACTN|nr:methyltransferase domain-containing protein [Aeromicrobium marinum]EFQ82062.1 methyltransferase domain protein [Aeromicrobium marinum DSM 15272]
MNDDLVGYDPAPHYDRITAAWQLLLGDELHYGVFDSGDEPLPVATRALTARMIDGGRLADPAPHGGPLRVLDVGCGSGAPACELATDHGVEVVGITTSAVGVATARARAADLGLSGVSFEQRDGTDNGFDDAQFDRAWVLESSHLMRDKDALVSECARVLRPGGRLVLCDLVRWREIGFAEVRERRVDFAVLRDAFGDAHFRTLDDYAALAESHGLVVDRVDDLTALTLPTFDRWRANADLHHDAVVELIGTEGHTAFVRSCDILEQFWRDGTFGYGLISATRPT